MLRKVHFVLVLGAAFGYFFIEVYGKISRKPRLAQPLDQLEVPKKLNPFEDQRKRHDAAQGQLRQKLMAEIRLHVLAGTETALPAEIVLSEQLSDLINQTPSVKCQLSTFISESLYGEGIPYQAWRMSYNRLAWKAEMQYNDLSFKNSQPLVIASPKTNK